ncbi:hypothetical protein CFK38_15775 [Brachybacterium vulturis]|uniref:Uncharacterized protein n=1 Tax=Brachybacterium vulturis TaxID=2017484 RepID=A0A291GS10_9MICO|nr:hypothetical protein [Brachybacterium vulturis]ATG52822.1 hypothetical protein CFK38_15775 [Brachybacterium vulturis]
MSDGESPTPAPRRRPSYGLPGPSSPAPGAAPSYGHSSYGDSPYGGPPYGGPPYGAPSDPAPGAHHGYDAPAGVGATSYGPQTGPLPASGAPGPAPRRRRGLLPLIIGLVLLLVVGPAATIGGIVWSVGSLTGDAASGPTVIDGASGEVDVSANEMLIVYVPQEDAAGAECSAEGSEPGVVSVVPSTSSVTFGDGSRYEQKIGVAVLEDTTVTISCTGTDAPAYLGPYSLLGMAAPLLIGPIIGLVSGLIGLVLTIVGIVLLVRSRRS